MIPPAPTSKRWALLAVALLPVTLVSVGVREQMAQAARQSSATDTSTAPGDGVYLYGNAPQPNQLLHHYVVFERQEGQVVGAFYSPHSEFTCFTGELDGTRLEVEALPPEQSPYAVQAQLSSLNPIASVSPNDQRILSICKQEAIALATN